MSRQESERVGESEQVNGWVGARMTKSVSEWVRGSKRAGERVGQGVG